MVSALTQPLACSTNKNKADPLLETVSTLHNRLPGADVCVHYSVKHQARPCRWRALVEAVEHSVRTLSASTGRTMEPPAITLRLQYAGGVEQAYQAFMDFCEPLENGKGHTSVLLVSGGGKRRKLDSVQARPLAGRL